MITGEQIEFLAKACESLVNKFALQQGELEDERARRIKALSIACNVNGKTPAKDVKAAMQVIRDILGEGTFNAED